MLALRPLLIALILALAPVVMTCAADTKETLQVAFSARATALLAAKTAGTLGETTAGLLAVPTGVTADDAAKKLLTDENLDRQALFKLLATETSATEAVVAERFARRVYQEAAAGMWLQKKDGAWLKK